MMGGLMTIFAALGTIGIIGILACMIALTVLFFVV